MPAVAEILLDGPVSQRGQRMLHAMRDAIPGAHITRGYHGSDRILIMYGAGTAHRQAVLAQHLARKGRALCWDLGYWDRADAMRVALDGLHPTAAHLELSHGQRRSFTLREDADPAGPVLLVGLGDKSARMLGLQPQQWERKQLVALKGRRVIYRPKGRAAPYLEGAETSMHPRIEDALRGVSMVVCRHSNVAVDACVAGVPVQCSGGAALALYCNGSNPGQNQRMDFLHRLSWWEWKPSEAAQAWQFLRGIISET